MAGDPGSGPPPATKEVPSRAVKCAQCGAPFTLRGFAHTKSVACEYCGSLFDTSTHDWQLIEKVERRRHDVPLWPLGTKARFEGKRFDLVGWMKRFVKVDHVRYSWEEHLFFNPFHGFRYLVYQEGHFTLVTPLPGYPLESSGMGRRALYEGETYRHFSSADAFVDDVVGEFPWRVQKGESVRATDYVAPPLVLSSETSEGETVWSRGVYMSQADVFAAVGKPPKRFVQPPRSVAPNQPNPIASAEWLGRATAFALVAWCLLTLLYVFRCSSEKVLDVDVPAKAAVAAVGTEEAPGNVYPLKLGTSRDPANLEVTARAGVDNGWAFLGCALIDTKNEHAYPFGLEVSYYHGYDDGESWSEGSRDTEELLGAIPNGDYSLQVERDGTYSGLVHLTIRRDVPLFRYPIAALFLIVGFPAILLFRSRAFEARRWAESDHAP